jgi:hypothetical protein
VPAREHVDDLPRRAVVQAGAVATQDSAQQGRVALHQSPAVQAVRLVQRPQRVQGVRRAPAPSETHTARSAACLVGQRCMRTGNLAAQAHLNSAELTGPACQKLEASAVELTARLAGGSAAPMARLERTRARPDGPRPRAKGLGCARAAWSASSQGVDTWAAQGQEGWTGLAYPARQATAPDAHGALNSP